MKYKLTAPACIVASFLVFGLNSGFNAPSAYAKTCDPTDNDIQAAQMTITRVNSRIDRLELTLVQTLKLHAGQISAYISQQTTAIGRMFDASNQSNAQIARETAEIKATRDFMPSAGACETVSGVLGSKAAKAFAEQAAKDATTAQTGRLTNSKGTPSQNGQSQDVVYRWDRRLKTWCNPESLQTGEDVCSGLAGNHNADINPGSLYGAKTLETELDRQAARDLITNLVAPFAPDPLPLENVNSEEERRQQLKRLSTQARLALATDTFNERYAQRLPAVNLGEWARAILPDGQIPGTEDTPDNISMKELQTILMSSRFDDPNYFVALQAMEPENVRREMATNQALTLSLLFKISENIERLTDIQATRLASEVEKELLENSITPGTEIEAPEPG